MKTLIYKHFRTRQSEWNPQKNQEMKEKHEGEGL